MNGALLSEYWPLFQQAALVTLRLSFFGILFSIITGVIVSFIQYYKIPMLKQITSVYIELSRNTPLLVQLFFIYFGFPMIGIVWKAETCAVVGIAFLGGSYMEEALRAGLEAVDPMQMESAKSLGMNGYQAMRYVILPQALAIAVPSIFANVIFLIKETSVVSAIAIPDLMYVAKDLMGNDYNTAEALFLLVVFYMIILIPVSVLATIVERRIRYGYGI